MNMNYVTSNITSLLDSLKIADGTFPSHVYCVTFFVPVCSLLFILMTINSQFPERVKTFLEIVLINLTLLFVLTTPCCNYLFLIFFTLIPILVVALIYALLQVPYDQNGHIQKSISEIQCLENFNQKFIGDYRGHLLLATSICILAVDFAFFPVWFSKTETYGWSVMDAGVGSFVFVHGLCSSNARKSNVQQNSNFKKCMLSSVPLFILGILRLVVTTAVGYHKVVPEYGIHWNFFFTLSFTKVICYIISTYFFFIPPGLLAALIGISHQTLLSKGMTEYVLSDLRRNFFEANKEGICSLLGFVSMYFFGVQVGQFLWKKRDEIKDFIYLLTGLLIFGFIGWTLMLTMHEYVQPVSRRMANLPYCIWVVTLTSLQIAIHLMYWIIIFVLSKITKKNFSECLLWKAINYNGLFYFLLANVLTGLVNLTFKTEKCDNTLSFLILILYLTILNISSIILYKKSIQLKFW